MTETIEYKDIIGKKFNFITTIGTLCRVQVKGIDPTIGITCVLLEGVDIWDKGHEMLCLNKAEMETKGPYSGWKKTYSEVFNLTVRTIRSGEYYTKRVRKAYAADPSGFGKTTSCAFE
jgi:hypothetical protein